MNLVNSIRKRYYRTKFPVTMQHMAKVAPHFRIDDDKIIWKKQIVGTLIPLSRLQKPVKKSCFIIATGPSIKDVDLTKLKGEVCFGVNGATALDGLTFTYYCVVDCDFIVNRFALVKKALLSQAHCLFDYYSLKLICERDASLLQYAKVSLIHRFNDQYNQPRLPEAEFVAWLQQQADILLHPTMPHQTAEVGFSKNAELGCFGGGTVAFYALQLAYFFGFDCVYILGMDLGGNQVRFYESAKNTRPSHLAEQYSEVIEPAFEIVHELCLRESFQVYNLSAQSRLPNEIIAKIDFPWLKHP